jgi:hypothetical protein
MGPDIAKRAKLPPRLLANRCCPRSYAAYNQPRGEEALLATLMRQRVESNLFFEQAMYLVLFASNAGGI